MKTFFATTLCGLATVLLTASSSLAMLAVDFNSGGSATESGYTGVGTGGLSGITGTGVGASVDVSLASDGAIDSRNRPDPNVSPVDLSRDFVFGVRGNGATYLDVILSGVDAGTYTFTGFFHDSDPASNAVRDATMDVDFREGGGGFSDAFTVARTDDLESPIGTGTFSFTSTGGDLSFRISSDKNGHLINGFTLAAVPEAGAFLVWSVLSGVAVVRYRGKRQA